MNILRAAIAHYTQYIRRRIETTEPTLKKIFKKWYIAWGVVFLCVLCGEVYSRLWLKWQYGTPLTGNLGRNLFIDIIFSGLVARMMQDRIMKK